MQIKMKVVKKVEMADRVVVTLDPELTELRPGDEVSGQLFIATSVGNAALKIGDELIIEIAEPEQVPVQ